MKWLLRVLTACMLSSAGYAADIEQIRACQPARPVDRGVADAAKIEQEIAAARGAADAPQRVPPLLDRLAAVYERMDRFDRAEATLREALTLRESSEADGAAIATTLVRLGLMQRVQNKLEHAEATLKRCIAIADTRVGAASAEAASCRNMLGLVYRDTSRYSEAESLLTNALQTREKVLPADHKDIEYTVNLLGTLYLLLGNPQRAEEYYKRSVAIAEKAYGVCHPVYATVQYFLADAYDAMGRPEAALPLREHSQALREHVLPPDDHSVAQGLMGLSETLFALGHVQRAESVARRAAELHEKIFGRGHYRTLRSTWALVRALEASGRVAEAQALILRGVHESSLERTPEYLWRFQNAYRGVLERTRNTSAAIFFGKQAVNTIQSIRARITTLEQALQRSFVSDEKVRVYRSLAALLIEQGRLPEAQQVMTMLKEEEFFDYIRSDTLEDTRKTRATFTAQEERENKRYQEISGKLADIVAEFETLRQKSRHGALTRAEEARRDELDKDLEVAQQAFDRVLAGLERELAAAGGERAFQAGARNLRETRARQSTLRALGHGAVILQYVMGTTDKLHILLTTRSIQIARASTISARDLNALIAQFRNELGNPSGNPLPTAQKLYHVLIAPVAEELRKTKAQTLMLSLDGALRYIPLAALHDGERYLVESYRVALLTEAATDKLKDAPQAQWRFAGLGLTDEIKGYSPLSAVKEELEGIIKQGTRGVLPGQAYFNKDFTAARMKRALDEEYPVLHIASHFVFQPGNSSKSFLLLGDGQALTLSDIKKQRFDFSYVDLLTLSACETAVGGGKDNDGREIEGFGALAQTQGAKGVIATLWKVADPSTGLFMQQLYRIREAKKGTTKAEALRQAQIGFIRGDVQGDARAKTERGLKTAAAPTTGERDVLHRYSHPYFWAPFILMGNWL